MEKSNNAAGGPYETVIGLEVHVELATKTKIFCGCPAKFGGVPNAHTCPVCTGMPGALPTLNRQAVEFAIAAGLAANCRILRECRFDRKNYFYPDNPQNYQISQLYQPICRDGGIEIQTKSGIKTVGVHEIHLEEDAGKLLHFDAPSDRENAAGGGAVSVADYNRAGVPLIEIVSEPDMRSAEEAVAYLEQLRMILRYLGVSDCKMQEGSLRADVNLSLRKAGADSLGVRTEMKNLNSFKAVARAVAHERDRQAALLDAGEKVVQETRRWDDAKGCSYSMRRKEEASDYRYFPEPDLPLLTISDEWIARAREGLPEFAGERKARYRNEYGLPEYDAGVLTESRALADFFEATAKLCGNPKKASNWIMGETLRLLNEKQMQPEELAFSPASLAKLIGLLDAGKINGTVAKEVFAAMFESGADPAAYVEENALAAVTDEGELTAALRKVIAENPKPVADFQSGKERAFGFLVGQAMKAMQGKADPAAVRLILKEILK